MARILFINSVCNGSTGTICKNLYRAAEKEGHTCCIAYGRGEEPKGFNTIKIGNNLDVYLHVAKARLFDASGFGSKRATKQFIKDIEEYNPDIIHLHNIHGYYINIEILFDYLRKHPEIKKIWTLHDCWAFTGHCPHYQRVKCIQWKTECKKCIRKKGYPKSFIDMCNVNFKKKKALFTNISSMYLITPSKWLKNELKDSFLKNYKIEVINNGIDTEVFKPVESNIKSKYNLINKKVILGVASVWDENKGLNTFFELSYNLSSDYQIVMIGLNDKQMKQIPPNILAIKKTENSYELAKWYSAAEVYFNPSLEDNYPTTNLEAVACGTPVLTFNTGGCLESAFIKEDKMINNNIVEIIDAIKNIKKKDINISLVSIKKTNEKYIKLYERI